jgi:methylated-DNA-[protein]-cysteine S-methyltransferase
MHPACVEIEPELIAAATGEAAAGAAARVQAHVERCAPCAGAFQRYRAIDGVVGTARNADAPPADVVRARKRLETQLADLRRRTLRYRIFPSRLGNILIALSEQGVSLVEYLGRARTLSHSRLARMAGAEPVEDGVEVEALFRELLDYLEGRQTRLEWPLDLRLARGDFDRMVLQATADIPYGAVCSYAGIACEVGKPTAARAVAQALRWNPLPIVVPCHRVIGTSGALTGYAGDKLGLKAELLAVEGVPTLRTARESRIPREAMYTGEPHDRWYCLPTCPSLVSNEHPHRMLFFASRERAEAAGREPCDTCRPDLNPVAH